MNPARVIGPTMFPVSQNIREKKIVCRVLAARFYVGGGKLAEVDALVTINYGDARDLEARGHVELQGEPFEVDSGIRAPATPREGARWMTNF